MMLKREKIFELANLISEVGQHLISTSRKPIKILKEQSKDIKLKADLETEELLRMKLAEACPIPVLGEELGTSEDFSFSECFILDPLDGSLNFSRGNPIYSISLAYVYEKKIVAGIVHNPVFNETFVGIVGEGAYLNGIRLEEMQNRIPSSAILATGIPSDLNIIDQESVADYFLPMMKFKKMRMIGSASQSLCWIPLGRVDAYMENSIKLWDVAAGLAILEAAGGAWTASRLNEDWSFNVRAASHLDLLKAILENIAAPLNGFFLGPQ